MVVVSAQVVDRDGDRLGLGHGRRPTPVPPDSFRKGLAKEAELPHCIEHEGVVRAKLGGSRVAEAWHKVRAVADRVLESLGVRERGERTQLLDRPSQQRRRVNAPEFLAWMNAPQLQPLSKLF